MARRIVGLDLGTYSVKLLRLETGKPSPRFEVQDVVEEVLDFSNQEEADLAKAQASAIISLFQRGLLDGETCASSLAGNFGQVRSMSVPFKDTNKINAVLPGLLDAEMPFELDDMAFTWYRPEKQPEVSENQEKDDTSLIKLAFGKKNSISSMLSILSQVQLDPRLLHLDSAAPYELIRELGCETMFHEPADTSNTQVGAIIDFGHTNTNLCVFNKDGIVSVKTFLKGGRHLTEEISNTLEITYQEAQKLKHELRYLSSTPEDEVTQKISKLAQKHFGYLSEQIIRTILSLRTSGQGDLRRIAMIGGGANTLGLAEFLDQEFAGVNVKVISLNSVLPDSVHSPSVSMAFALALSCLHVHAKENRFNFRKGEFAWRGELDFLRTKSTPLILWSLIIICSLTVLWAAKSMILDKENLSIESKLKAACSQILQDKNSNPTKCLALMKEQISANSDMGIPEHTASEVYLNLAKFIPNDISVKITEMDISENRVKLSAETKSFEDVDKVIAQLNKVPCLTNIESGRAQSVDNVVRFSPTIELNCKAATTAGGI